MHKYRCKRIVGIDPSIRFMGIAILRGSSGKLLTYTLLVGPRGPKNTWISRAARCVDMVQEWWGSRKKAMDIRTSLFVIEMPQVFGSRRGRRGLQTESVQKLYYLVGRLTEWVEGHGGDVLLVHPSKWKGQVPKQITRRRVLRRHPKLIQDRGLMSMGAKRASNIFDAIGLADYGLDKRKDRND